MLDENFTAARQFDIEWLNRKLGGKI